MPYVIAIYVIYRVINYTFHYLVIGSAFDTYQVLDVMVANTIKSILVSSRPAMHLKI